MPAELSSPLAMPRLVSSALVALLAPGKTVGARPPGAESGSLRRAVAITAPSPSVS
jgi:hypothetical protein